MTNLKFDDNSRLMAVRTYSSFDQRRKRLVDGECGSVGNYGHVSKLDCGPLPAIGLAAHYRQR